jgi:hypothetical protein
MDAQQDLTGKTVLFCAIFEGTVLMHAMARQLRERGCRVVWTVTHRTWRQYLLDQGEVPDDILDLRVDRRLEPSTIPLDRMDEILCAERRLGLTLCSITMMDRFIMDRRDPDAWRFLAHYYGRLADFVERHRVDLAISEPTNANDIMTYFVTASRGVPCYQITSIRIPSQRSALFVGCREAEIHAHRNLPHPDGLPDVHEILRAQREQGAKPIWYARNNRAAIFRASDVSGLIRNLYHNTTDGQRSLTAFTIRTRIASRFQQLANKFYVQHAVRFTPTTSLPRPFALFALQVQPERSVDVNAPFASNQLEMIRNVRRALPSNLALVVKEHSNLLGGRGRQFFREVAAMPNTYLVDPFTDSAHLVNQARLVFAITGTILFEAALRGVPSVSFERMYFNRLSLSFCCTDVRSLPDIIVTALSATQDQQKDVAFMRFLLENSVEGYFADATREPSFLSARNVSALVRLVASALHDAAPASVPTGA